MGIWGTARDERVNARNENYCAIVNNMHLTKSAFDLTNQFHALFWFGDLNYRINIPRQDVIKLVAGKQWDKLCRGDQLLLVSCTVPDMRIGPWSNDWFGGKERKHGRCFVGFKEPLIRFPPSYRYNRGDRTYSEEKMRTPSYCDRILYKPLPGLSVKCYEYTTCDRLTTSDHSPVYGVFSIPLLRPDVSVCASAASSPVSPTWC